MEHWVENLLSELNSISRMAVLEEAYETEKMLCDYSKILKYRLSKMNQTVTLSMETDIVAMLFSLYQTKWKHGFTFAIGKELNIKSVFVPHYSILSYVSFLFEYFEKINANNLNITYDTFHLGEHLSIVLTCNGALPFTKLKSLMEQDTSSEYDDISVARLRWVNVFGENTILIDAKDNKYLTITFLAYEE